MESNLFLRRTPQVIASEVLGWLLRDRVAGQRLHFVERIDDGDLRIAKARQLSSSGQFRRQLAAERFQLFVRRVRAVLRAGVSWFRDRRDLLAEFNHEVRSGLVARFAAVNEPVGKHPFGVLFAVARPFGPRVVEQEEAAAFTGDAGRNDCRIDGDDLPAVGVGPGCIGHAPGRSPLPEHDARQITARPGPGDIWVLAGRECRTPFLFGITGTRPLDPFRSKRTDRHAVQDFAAGQM